MAIVFAIALSGVSTDAYSAQKKKAVKKKSVAAKAVVPAFTFADKPDVQEFIKLMLQKHQVPPQQMQDVFSQTKYLPEVVRLMTPGTGTVKRSWQTYRSRYIDELRIREGVQFWRTHEQALNKAQQQYGVPAAYIVSIIGVETVYGRVTGNFRVIDVLATLAFAYPRRAAFFKEELEQFLVLAKDQSWNPLVPKGSFAGAMGLPQFMPGSIRRHAVDFSGDSKIDLLTNPTDAIGSVANFFVNHGWQAGKQPFYSANINDGINIDTWLEGGIKPRFTAEQLAQGGIVLNLPTINAGIASATHSAPTNGDLFALIDFPTPNEPTQYILAAQNFYTITRYNQSSFYAMAVIDLAQALERAMQLANSEKRQ